MGVVSVLLIAGKPAESTRLDKVYQFEPSVTIIHATPYN